MITRIEGDILASNVYVISNGRECFIVDAGVKLNVLKQYVRGQKVLGVFLTHGHYDHIYYLEDYLSEFGCKAYASEFAKEYICDADKNLSKIFYNHEMEIKNLSKVNFLCADGTIKIGDFEIEYFQLGGHSKGDMVFVFEKNLFVGDLILGDSIGRIDMYGGDKNAMIKSLDFLENYDYKIMYSGHGSENRKETQDNVVRLWKKFLDR